MKIHRRGPLMLALALYGAAALAQAPALPKELSGRWTFAPAKRSNMFSLDEIEAQGEQGFKARLTWWASDPKCTIHKEPITGRYTATTLTFDATTKCNVPFTTELARADKGWVGKATTHDTNNVVLELKAD